MVTKSKTMPAGRFKARCLSVLDEVRDSRCPVLITKHGKPVARLVPVEDQDARASLRDSVLHEGDLLSPIDAPWNADS